MASSSLGSTAPDPSNSGTSKYAKGVSFSCRGSHRELSNRSSCAGRTFCSTVSRPSSDHICKSSAIPSRNDEEREGKWIALVL